MSGELRDRGRVAGFVLIGVACAALCASCHGQPIGVYESEANFEQYKGIYQGQLRVWLGERKEEFEIIGDEIAADPEALAEYPVVMTSSCYIVPDEAAKGLAEYVAQGGRLIWIDSPARCGDATLRKAIGIDPAGTYAPLTDCRIFATAPDHPAALSVTELEANGVVGNCAEQAHPEATVLYELEGTNQEDAAAQFPAVTLARHGKGFGLCYNWILWCSPEPETRTLLADGLDWALADSQLRDEDFLALCRPTRRVLRQPESIAVACKAYARENLAGDAASWEVRLADADGETVAGPVRGSARWTHADGDMRAGVTVMELPSANLPDGDYRVIGQATIGEVTSEGEEMSVALSGELWTRLQEARKERRRLLEPLLLGTLGDYDAEPRTPEGRVDIPRLMEQIETAHMNMYDWLIWHAPTDWEDLALFLPVAKAKGIKVWVTLCPPSEQGGAYPWSEPYRLDFIKWADEIGKLSCEYDNLVGLVIDDFWSGGNRTLFTPDYIGKLAETLQARNPNVAFLPTIYWGTIGDEQWMEDFGPAIDGIVFPYAELATGDALAEQLAACREWIGPDRFLMMNLYASGGSGSSANASVPRTPEYMRKALRVSREMCDGIRIYCLPKGNLLDDHRFAITAELYEEWGEGR